MLKENREERLTIAMVLAHSFIKDLTKNYDTKIDLKPNVKKVFNEMKMAYLNVSPTLK